MHWHLPLKSFSPGWPVASSQDETGSQNYLFMHLIYSIQSKFEPDLDAGLHFLYPVGIQQDISFVKIIIC